MPNVFTQSYVMCLTCLVSWVTYAPFKLPRQTMEHLLPQNEEVEPVRCPYHLAPGVLDVNLSDKSSFIISILTICLLMDPRPEPGSFFLPHLISVKVTRFFCSYCSVPVGKCHSVGLRVGTRPFIYFTAPPTTPPPQLFSLLAVSWHSVLPVSAPAPLYSRHCPSALCFS